jgi:uncharacterized protein YciI
MKHFMVELTYIVPAEKLEEFRAAHRDFLMEGFNRGILLYAGGQEPRVGGIALARAESRQALEDYFATDPYKVNGLSEYRYVEFKPAKYQPFLDEWMAGQ